MPGHADFLEHFSILITISFPDNSASGHAGKCCLVSPDPQDPLLGSLTPALKRQLDGKKSKACETQQFQLKHHILKEAFPDPSQASPPNTRSVSGILGQRALLAVRRHRCDFLTGVCLPHESEALRGQAMSVSVCCSIASTRPGACHEAGAQ